jgi:hypothetical protein
MRSTTADTARLPAPDDIHDQYERGGFDAMSDAEVFETAAAIVSVPRRDSANSFILHAPLELMARRLLLPLVAPSYRRAVRERLLWIAAKYEWSGEALEPGPEDAYDSVARARETVLGALGDGDVDAVDGAAVWLLDRATVDEVMALAGPTLDRLAAAGHAPIGFFLASRLATTSRAAIALLRPTLRELARAPQLRIEWLRDAAPPRGDEAGLADALASTPLLGIPGYDSVFPVVHQVDGEVARELLDATRPADPAAAARATLRVAVHSMLQDDPTYAAYGWTHCLTLPQAILELVPWLADADAAVAIAATYVVAFRAAEGSHAIDLDWVPAPVATGPLDALGAPPAVAAAAWWHASDAAVAAARPELIGRAASHEDAHLAKYTLACVAAAERDRAHRRLYLAAAASLAAWWAERGDRGFRNDL